MEVKLLVGEECIHHNTKYASYNGDNGELYSCHFRQVAVKYEAGSGLNGSMDAPINVIKTNATRLEIIPTKDLLGLQLLFWWEWWGCERVFSETLEADQGKIRALSIEENLELERELASLNKPAVKTIRTIYGDIYDCVDQYKQPSLDHPLLKDHKIQAELCSEFINARASRPSGISSVYIGLDDECPSGTVPIRRTTKEELLRAKTSFRKLFPSFYQANADDIIKPKEFLGRKQSTVYHGGAGYISICNPAVEPGQFSSSVIAIEGGPADSFSTIRVGWMVYIVDA
ncbi:uncharacterized protein LOC116143342 [Pistacia vera]|uniref:uncharacterized protein LOC116143342 n=1 Tax=Pistacia vera TaxID=55513 RepID=UPI001263B402|nr:uncharacterized protein LOC116143342 [Pistacia vera]